MKKRSISISHKNCVKFWEPTRSSDRSCCRGLYHKFCFQQTSLLTLSRPFELSALSMLKYIVYLAKGQLVKDILRMT